MDLREVLVVEPGHDVPSVDLVGDDAFGLKRPERFAQRAARNADALGEFDLPDLLPWQQHAVDDQTADLRRRLQGELRLSVGRPRFGYHQETPSRKAALRFYRNNVCN